LPDFQRREGNFNQMLYRIRSTGAVLTQGEVRGLHPFTSFPAVWDASTCDAIGVDPILPSPQPTPSLLETVYADGVVQDSLGNWVEKWSTRPLFSDYTDEDGVLHTRVKQEQAFLTKRDEDQWTSIRTDRNKRLAECDWTQLSDAPVDSLVWSTYRQALRDITTQADPFNIVWPEAPDAASVNE